MLMRAWACGNRKCTFSKRKEKNCIGGIAHIGNRHIGVVGPIVPAEQNMPDSQAARRSESKDMTLRANSEGIATRT
jgi:hypothetical protein